MRKLLVSALVLAMVLGFGGLAFGAAGSIAGPAFSDIAGHEAGSELTLLAALGAFTGDTGIGGTVRPDAPITRAEFAKIVVVGLGKGSTAASLSSLKPTFKDEIPTWAWGYVQCAQFMGIVGGYTDGTFRASNNVTYGEAVTMLVKGVFGHLAQVPPGVWPYNFLFYGVDAEFTGGVEVGFANLPATRGDLARMLVATMQVDKLDKDGEKKDDTSVLFPKTVKGTFTSYNLGDNPAVILTGGTVPLADPVYIIGASHYAGLVGLNVWAVKNADGKAVALWVKQTANSVKGVFAEYSDEDTVTGNDTYVLADGTKIPITLAATGPPVVVATQVTVNGAMAVAENMTATLAAKDECTFTLGSDGKATNVTVLRFDMGKCFVNGTITKSTATVDTQVPTLAGTISVEKSAAISVNSGTIGRDTLAKWDVLYLATKLGNNAYQPDSTAPNYSPIFAIRGARQGIEGTVKSVRSVTTAATGTTHYATFEFADKSTKEYAVLVLAAGGNIPVVLTVSSSGKYGLDDKGKIYVQQQYVGAATSVLLKSYSSGTAGIFVTVDARGSDVTYVGVYALSAHVGSVGVIAINPANNYATGFTPYVPAGTTYDVVAVDVVNGNVTLKQSGTTNILFIVDAVVYKYDKSDDTYTYVPFDQVGYWVSDTTGTIDHFITVYGTGPLVVYTVP